MIWHFTNWALPRFRTRGAMLIVRQDFGWFAPMIVPPGIQWQLVILSLYPN